LFAIATRPHGRGGPAPDSDRGPVSRARDTAARHRASGQDGAWPSGPLGAGLPDPTPRRSLDAGPQIGTQAGIFRRVSGANGVLG